MDWYAGQTPYGGGCPFPHAVPSWPNATNVTDAAACSTTLGELVSAGEPAYGPSAAFFFVYGCFWASIYALEIISLIRASRGCCRLCCPLPPGRTGQLIESRRLHLAQLVRGALTASIGAALSSDPGTLRGRLSFGAASVLSACFFAAFLSLVMVHMTQMARVSRILALARVVPLIPVSMRTSSNGSIGWRTSSNTPRGLQQQQPAAQTPGGAAGAAAATASAPGADVGGGSALLTPHDGSTMAYPVPPPLTPVDRRPALSLPTAPSVFTQAHTRATTALSAFASAGNISFRISSADSMADVSASPRRLNPRPALGRCWRVRRAVVRVLVYRGWVSWSDVLFAGSLVPLRIMMGFPGAPTAIGTAYYALLAAFFSFGALSTLLPAVVILRHLWATRALMKPAARPQVSSAGATSVVTVVPEARTSVVSAGAASGTATPVAAADEAAAPDRPTVQVDADAEASPLPSGSPVQELRPSAWERLRMICTRSADQTAQGRRRVALLWPAMVSVIIFLFGTIGCTIAAMQAAEHNRTGRLLPDYGGALKGNTRNWATYMYSTNALGVWLSLPVPALLFARWKWPGELFKLLWAPDARIDSTDSPRTPQRDSQESSSPGAGAQRRRNSFITDAVAVSESNTRFTTTGTAMTATTVPVMSATAPTFNTLATVVATGQSHKLMMTSSAPSVVGSSAGKGSFPGSNQGAQSVVSSPHSSFSAYSAGATGRRSPSKAASGTQFAPPGFIHASGSMAGNSTSTSPAASMTWGATPTAPLSPGSLRRPVPRPALSKPTSPSDVDGGIALRSPRSPGRFTASITPSPPPDDSPAALPPAASGGASTSAAAKASAVPLAAVPAPANPVKPDVITSPSPAAAAPSTATAVAPADHRPSIGDPS